MYVHMYGMYVYVYMYVSVCLYVCMYLSLSVCMYVCMYVCTFSTNLNARYGLDGPGIESQGGWGSEIVGASPDRPCGPPNLLYNGHRVSFPGVKRRDVVLVTHPLLALRLRIGATSPPPLCACIDQSWCDLYLQQLQRHFPDMNRLRTLPELRSLQTNCPLSLIQRTVSHKTLPAANFFFHQIGYCIVTDTCHTQGD